MVFKKDLSPVGGKKGRVITHKGKGATEQRTAPGERETLTGGSPMGRMMNKYPAAPQPPPNAQPPAPGGSIGPQPTAAMPMVPDEAE